MFSQALNNIGWAISFIIVGSLVGSLIVVMAAGFMPRIIDKLTPSIDEDKEILRGNQAVAEYFGRISAAAILGVSIVVAAAVLGGILAGLHG
jgi:uncharacterized membrane protein YjfL (UPF0719 family)